MSQYFIHLDYPAIAYRSLGVRVAFVYKESTNFASQIFNLERSENGGPWIYIACIENGRNTYIDPHIKIGVRYRYRIKARSEPNWFEGHKVLVKSLNKIYLVSKPYPLYAQDSIEMVAATLNSFFLYEGHYDYIDFLDVTLNNFHLKDTKITHSTDEVLNTYELTDVTLGNFVLKDTLITYSDDEPVNNYEITNVSLGDFQLG